MLSNGLQTQPCNCVLSLLGNLIALQLRCMFIFQTYHTAAPIFREMRRADDRIGRSEGPHGERRDVLLQHDPSAARYVRYPQGVDLRNHSCQAYGASETGGD